MIFVKSLSVVILFLIYVFVGHWIEYFFVEQWEMPKWLGLLFVSGIAMEIALMYPKMVRRVARAFSVDISYWEENRNELVVVRVSTYLFFLIWLIHIVGEFLMGGYQWLAIIPEWARTYTLGGVIYLGWEFARWTDELVAKIFSIEYPNLKRRWAEAVANAEANASRAKED